MIFVRTSAVSSLFLILISLANAVKVVEKDRHLRLSMTVNEYIVRHVCDQPGTANLTTISVLKELNGWLKGKQATNEIEARFLLQNYLDPLGDRTRFELDGRCMTELAVLAYGQKEELDILFFGLMSPQFLILEKADPRLSSIIIEMAKDLIERFGIEDYLELVKNSHSLDGRLYDVTRMLVENHWPLLNEDTLTELQVDKVDASRFRMFSFVSQTTAFQQNQPSKIPSDLIVEFDDYEGLDIMALRAAQQEVGLFSAVDVSELARGGCVEALEFIQKKPHLRAVQEHADLAAEFGHVDMLNWLKTNTNIYPSVYGMS